MVLLLARDVVANGFAVRGADGKCPVAVLPNSRSPTRPKTIGRHSRQRFDLLLKSALNLR